MVHKIWPLIVKYYVSCDGKVADAFSGRICGGDCGVDTAFGVMVGGVFYNRLHP